MFAPRPRRCPWPCPRTIVHHWAYLRRTPSRYVTTLRRLYAHSGSRCYWCGRDGTASVERTLRIAPSHGSRTLHRVHRRVPESARSPGRAVGPGTTPERHRSRTVPEAGWRGGPSCCRCRACPSAFRSTTASASSPRRSAASSTRPTATSSSSSSTTRARTAAARSPGPSATRGSGSSATRHACRSPTTGTGWSSSAAPRWSSWCAPTTCCTRAASSSRSAPMEADPGLALVASRRHMIDEQSRVIVPRRGLTGLTGVRTGVEVARQVVRNGSNPIGEPGNVLFRREDFFAVGGWRARPHLHHGSRPVDAAAAVRRVPRAAGDARRVPDRPRHRLVVQRRGGSTTQQRMLLEEIGDSPYFQVRGVDLTVGRLLAPAGRARGARCTRSPRSPRAATKAGDAA